MSDGSTLLLPVPVVLRLAARRAVLLPGAAGAGEEAQQRQRHPDDRALAEELAAADIAGLVLVDDVVLELAAGSDGIDLSLNVVPAHFATPLDSVTPCTHGTACQPCREATGRGGRCLDFGRSGRASMAARGATRRHPRSVRASPQRPLRRRPLALRRRPARGLGSDHGRAGRVGRGRGARTRRARPWPPRTRPSRRGRRWRPTSARPRCGAPTRSCSSERASWRGRSRWRAASRSPRPRARCAGAPSSCSGTRRRSGARGARSWRRTARRSGSTCAAGRAASWPASRRGTSRAR